MQRSLLTFALLASTSGLLAQTTAMDWTKTDCDAGITHSIFSELNEGKVIVQEYAMPPSCGGCWQAAQAIAPVIDAFELSDPGRVKFYATGYNNAYTCAQMNSWKAAYSLTPSVFINGASEVSYYGGMGMPTVVVLGGGYGHGVYGKWIGFGAWLIEDLTDSIQLALDAANAIAEQEQSTGMVLYPSPAGEQVNIEVDATDRITAIDFIDLTGHMVSQHAALDGSIARIDLGTIPTGSYVVRVATASGALLRSPFQVIH